MSDFVGRVPAPRQGFGGRLARLDLELTERCDNDCLHCCINLPAGDRAARAAELSTAQVRNILDQAAALGCLQVRYTGGEPLLRADFEELYLHARRLGIKVLVFTNARRITPRLADLLARVPPLVPAEVTVYGMRAESYEAVTRVPGSFAQFRRGVDLLLDRGVPFVVKAALLPPNRGEMDEFEAWAATIPRMVTAPNYVMTFDLRNRRDDEQKNEQIRRLRFAPDDVVAVLTRRPDEYRRSMLEFGRKFMGPQGDTLFACGAGHGVSVDAYGRAQPCMGVRAPGFAVSLVEDRGGGSGGPAVPDGAGLPDVAADRGYAPDGGPVSLAAALERLAALGDVRAQSSEYLRRCARCFLKGLCDQCPAKSWAEHGTLDTPVEYVCEVAHAQARWLGWLAEDEYGWEVEHWRERIT